MLTRRCVAQVRSSKQDQIHNSIVSTLLALMDGLDSRGSVVVIGQWPSTPSILLYQLSRNVPDSGTWSITSLILMPH